MKPEPLPETAGASCRLPGPRCSGVRRLEDARDALVAERENLAAERKRVYELRKLGPLD